MKKRFLLPISLVLFTGCKYAITNVVQKEVIKGPFYPVSNYMNEEMKEIPDKKFVMTCYVGEGISEYANKADYIVLATIISLDNADTKLPNGETSELGYTFGRMLIQKTYKGVLKKGEVLHYIKNGGVVTAAQIDEATPIEIKDARQNVQYQDMKQNSIYINTNNEDNISFEEGKTYLMDLKYVEDLERYHVIGHGLTTRETDITRMKMVRRIDDVDNFNVKNILTKRFEPINDVLTLYQ